MNEYLKQHKIYLILFVVCLIAAVVSGMYLKISNNQETKTKQLPITNTTSSLNHSITTSQPNNDFKLNTYNLKTTTSTSTFFPSPDETTSTVTLKINNKSRTVPIATSTTVYEMMKYYSLIAADSDFHFETKEYSGLGMFVIKIGDVTYDAQTGQYWIYYLNDQPAKMGISSYILKPNDLIEWKYGSTNF